MRHPRIIDATPIRNALQPQVPTVHGVPEAQGLLDRDAGLVNVPS